MNYSASFFKITQPVDGYFVDQLLPANECELFSDCLKHTTEGEWAETRFCPKGTFEYVTQPIYSANCSYDQHKELWKKFNQQCEQFCTPDRLPISQTQLDVARVKRNDIESKIKNYFLQKHRPLINDWTHCKKIEKEYGAGYSGNSHRLNWQLVADEQSKELIRKLNRNESVESELLQSIEFSIDEFFEFNELLKVNRVEIEKRRAKIAKEWNTKYEHLGIIFS